ncbi:MAG TPA: hypothetical protein VGG48_11170 [Rhizomicrobium sp.]|jgi:hypothetical protein
MKTFVLAAFAVFLAASAAQGRDVRLPDSGYPAFTLTIPDDWATQAVSGGGQITFPPNHTTVVTTEFDTYSGAIDDFAASIIKAVGADPPVRVADATVSGFKGVIYQSSMTNGAGVRGNMRMTVVQIDSQHYAVYASIEADGVSAADAAAAANVISSVGIVTKAQ